MSFPRLVTDQDCRLGGTAMFDLIITWWFDDYIPVSCLLLIHPLEEVVHLNIKLDELRIRPYVIPFSFNQYIHRFLMVKWRFRLVEYFDFLVSPTVCGPIFPVGNRLFQNAEDQSLRAWLCGGDIVRAKSSRIAHMWRTGDRRTAHWTATNAVFGCFGLLSPPLIFWGIEDVPIYPLVNIQKIMENHHAFHG